MASAQSILVLQNPNFKWKNQSHHSPQLLPPQNYFCRGHIKIVKSSVKKLSVNCLFTTNNNSAANQSVSKISFEKSDIKQNPVEIVAETVMNMLRSSGSGSCRKSWRSYSTSTSRTADDDDDEDEDEDVDESPGDASGLIIDCLILIAFGLLVKAATDKTNGLTVTKKTSVLKLQVGLLGSGRSSLQKDLNWIAETADTSTSKGLHYVLTETIVALLRHTDYCISGYSSVVVKKSMEAGEKKFNKLSVEERGKIDEETLVNVNNIKKKSSTIVKADGFSSEYIVVTILVAAEGEHKLPSINSSKDLKEALQELASIPSTRTLAVEVLWTPQKEDDTLSERDLQEDYPLLRPLQ